jgi:hypothetical protein
MQKYLWLAFLAGGLWFAKTRFYDEPKAKTPTKAEQAAEAFGRYAKTGKLPDSVAAQAVSTDTANAQGFLESLQALTGSNKSPAQRAEARFEQFMKSWQNGGVSESDEAQAAACLWSRGSRVLPGEETTQAATFFDLWRKEKSLYVETIRYDVLYFTPKDDHIVAVVSINGEKYQMGVPYAANPIFWVN